MAYMRGEWYVYSDGENINIHGSGVDAAIPIETMQELALMIVCDLDDDHIRSVADRVVEKHSGNVGASAVIAALGGEGLYEWINRVLSQHEDSEDCQCELCRRN